MSIRKALSDGKTPLPEKPMLEAGDDRFFSDVYLGKDGPFVVSEKDETKSFTPEQRQQTVELQQTVRGAEEERTGGTGNGVRGRRR
ncbi:MAG: hypothetical protein WKF84_17140 [Pyrinomonadaceae bacterium]